MENDIIHLHYGFLLQVFDHFSLTATLSFRECMNHSKLNPAGYQSPSSPFPQSDSSCSDSIYMPYTRSHSQSAHLQSFNLPVAPAVKYH